MTPVRGIKSVGGEGTRETQCGLVIVDWCSRFHVLSVPFLEDPGVLGSQFDGNMGIGWVLSVRIVYCWESR